jgi:hypothetical protein
MYVGGDKLYKNIFVSEPPVWREADTVEDVFETVGYHQAECSGRPELDWCRFYG